ncbi:MAG: ABC transporter permease, partial [Blastocatellia bacterium]
MLAEIKYAIRVLKESPGLLFAAIVIIGLGIGASTTIFSVVDTVLLRGLPYKDPGKLVAVEGNFDVLKMANIAATPREYLDYRDQNKVFEKTGAFSVDPYNLKGGDHPESVEGARISDNLLDLLGIQPTRGRGFAADDYRTPQIQTAIISDSLWSRRFGRSEDVIGQTISMNDTSYRIVGVMPEGVGFQYLRPNVDDKVDVWLPLVFDQDEMNRPGGWFLRVIGRLKHGVDFGVARADLSTIGGNFVQRFPHTYRGPNGEDGGWKTTVFPLKQQVLGNVSTSLFVLLTAVGFVLLIACANLAGLMLARGAPRRSEIAIRSALGAGRLQITRELMIEALMLSALGGAAGLVLVLWTRNLIVALGGALLPRLRDLTVDASVFGFAVLLSVLTPLLFALIPALSLSRANLSEHLKTGARGAVPSHNRLFGVLVSCELALSLILLISAGLMIRSFIALKRTNLGFNPVGVVTLNIALPASYDGPKTGQFFHDLLGRLGSANGIESASLSFNAFKDPFSIEGKPFSASNLTVAHHRSVGPDYFRCLQIPLVAGREFSSDDVQGRTPVAVINKSLANNFFAGEDPLGHHIKVGAPSSPSPWLTIVGVVGDVRDGGPALPPEPEMYAAYLQSPFGSATLLARSAQPTSAVVSVVQDELGQLDNTLPVSKVSTVEEGIGGAISEPRFDTILLATFSLIALVLSITGIYGVG